MSQSDILRGLAVVADVIQRKEGKDSESVALIKAAMKRIEELDEKLTSALERVGELGRIGLKQIRQIEDQQVALFNAGQMWAKMQARISELEKEYRECRLPR